VVLSSPDLKYVCALTRGQTLWHPELRSGPDLHAIDDDISLHLESSGQGHPQRPLQQCKDTFFKVAETRASMTHLRLLGDLACQDIDLFAQTYTVLSSTHDGNVVVAHPNEQIVVVPGPISEVVIFSKPP